MADARENQQESERRSDETESISIEEPKVNKNLFCSFNYGLFQKNRDDNEFLRRRKTKMRIFKNKDRAPLGRRFHLPLKEKVVSNL